ncbi:MAG: nitrogen regulation protein NR(I) [Candidatus Rokubacteria bacterium 13_1_20CM_2_68_19]|nr:MAG: nitrogen regulation protein NR(I) [Candidatus Rokubacteria bacterium 13_1_40CM_2_68_13]OLE42737.1 MAG: nitrogen regulation protein NR(I) [Candidatus Rokubacteria bacterium 13_1_20CM_2_68_19]PYN63584.1 MAG: nitrogen regulation protein NR(I) [Candidatus Rokubacteria bacterium]
MMAARILIADDEDSLRWVLEKGLRGVGYDVTSVKDGEEAVRVFEAQPFDLVFLDVRMPGLDGLTALERIRDLRPDVYVIVMTAHGSMDTAIKAMQRGAYDYLNKPFDLDEVLLLSERALAASRLTQEVARLRTGLAEVREFSALIGRHPRMQDVYKTIGRIAGTDVTVLLRGESGTGKELVARAIHHYSRRSGRPFVAVSCAAIPGTLLESEMFGHERGAFTDAKERRLGKFELAHGGTLYLDEIGDMPVDLQTKLLRALQERTIERVGGHESIAIDVRVLAATNRDLEALMKEGRFREDLYYRLNVVTVNLPPLRERRRDIPLLVEHFLAKHVEELGERGVAPEALDRLVGYDWPGNVRELENVVQRAMVMATAGVILPEHLPIGPVSAAASVAVDATLEEIIERKLMECVRGLRERSSANLYDLVVGLVEKPLLRAVLRETSGNQVRAAQILGINRNTLRKKLTEHGIDPDAITSA